MDARTHAIADTPLHLGLGACCMVLFTRAFLGTKELLPRVDRVMHFWSVGLAWRF